MRLLLDTHVILWWYFDSSRLSREHVQLISEFWSASRLSRRFR